jgi:hypothetical protein
MRPERVHVDPGEKVVVVLKNGYFRKLYGNLCFVRLERRCGARWIPASNNELNRVCTLQLDIYPRGLRAEIRFRLDPETPPGTYRAVTNFEGLGDVGSEPFTVGPSRPPGPGGQPDACMLDGPGPDAR